jgi:hypothetical protein
MVYLLIKSAEIILNFKVPLAHSTLAYQPPDTDSFYPQPLNCVKQFYFSAGGPKVVHAILEIRH